MNFEKIDIYGFKSFADKAEIKFGNGITGIVGPNGCGKSNVADAIKWVLGEQSPKSLRGSSMQDVIFSGTQDRKSLSYCEVSLYFDNTNKMFPVEYNEVIITRKLYRSGESEYYINKQPSRLRDIVDLLHECGIGKEGYTIIGQGKVEEIMSAKPEDRRLIFEEATGIAKNKTRKLEAERKLERTHENVMRILDVIAVKEEQLHPLERQAEKAKQFNEISAELKMHELNTYVAKVEGVETAKGKINDKIKGIEEAVALNQQRYNETQAEYEHNFNEISGADLKLKKLNDELADNRVLLERKSGSAKVFQERISFILGQKERTETSIAENEKQIEELKKVFSDNNREIDQLSEQYDQLDKKSRHTDDELLTVSNKLALSEELNQEHNKKVIESIESLTDVKVNSGTMSVEMKNLTDKLDELNVTLDDYSVKREKLFNEKDKYENAVTELDKSVYELKNTIIEQENKVKECNEKVSETENKIFSLNTLIATLVSRDNFYRDLRENYEGYADAVKNLMNRAKTNPTLKSKIKGVVAELIKSDKKYDVALETALAAAAQNIVTEDTEDARYLIQYLKDNDLGRVTCLPVSSVKYRERNASVTLALRERGALGVADEIVDYDKKYENVITNLLGNTLIVDTLENAKNIADKYRFAFKIVTLDGDVFATQGSITGGSRKKNTAGVLSSERKLEDNAELLKAKRKEMDALTETKKKAEEERDNALDQLSVFNETYNSKRQEIGVEREKLASAESSLIEINKDIERVNDLIDSVNERISKIDENYKAVQSGGKKLEEYRKIAKDNAEKQFAEFEELKKQKDALSEESTRLKLEFSDCKNKIETLKADNERVKNSIKEAEENNVKLREGIANTDEIVENLRLEQEKVALTKEEQDHINSIRKEIEKIEENKEVLREKCGKNEEDKKLISEEITALGEKKHAEEIALAKIDSDLEYMQQSIWEDYQETYETASKQKIENYDAVNGEKEIERLRRKRSSLGAINANAIEEYKALKESYDDYIKQKEDLEKAEADIQEAIDTIKKDMLSKFDEGFNKINENFKRIFKELFGGGRAMLELDYGEYNTDKLEAGIEIIAEPPGKKLQKLSLLSGGEKALTAIAILFSILKLRPMPFCVLDEIEAALDEANVDRFARYLKKFSEETQFIVITHRKPTMELADALFGVTMQEKGVSKMVSVKLSDVASVDSMIS